MEYLVLFFNMRYFGIIAPQALASPLSIIRKLSFINLMNLLIYRQQCIENIDQQHAAHLANGVTVMVGAESVECRL